MSIRSTAIPQTITGMRSRRNENQIARCLTSMVITSRNIEQTALPARSAKVNLLKQVRQLHLYLGVFFAPAILFFSLTGALQLFGLHEGHPGEAYQPPKWISTLSSIHKDQVLSQHHGPPPGSAGVSRAMAASPDIKRPLERSKEPRGGKEHQEIKATLVLKWFFLAMFIGLTATTLPGIYMAFEYNRSRVIVSGLLIAGFAMPMALIALLA